jgi:hypothetical protein
MPCTADSTDTTARSLRSAAATIRRAAVACHCWEVGGDADDVADTAALARRKAQIALEAVVSDEPWNSEADEPETRRARLAYASWLMLLAGTDEHGQSSDLEDAARLLDAAADA